MRKWSRTAEGRLIFFTIQAIQLWPQTCIFTQQNQSLDINQWVPSLHKVVYCSFTISHNPFQVYTCNWKQPVRLCNTSLKGGGGVWGVLPFGIHFGISCDVLAPSDAFASFIDESFAGTPHPLICLLLVLPLFYGINGGAKDIFKRYKARSLSSRV